MNWRFIEKLTGLLLLVAIAFSAASVFPIHERLYSWPTWGVASLIFIWLAGFVYATALILGV